MSFAIDQALVSRFISGNFGLPIAHENMDYDPVPGTPYAEIIVLQNDITPYSLSGSSETDGVLHVILRYPTGKGAIPAKQMADTIKAHFPIGQCLTYGGTKLTITRQHRQPGAEEAGWYKLLLTITYKAFLER